MPATMHAKTIQGFHTEAKVKNAIATPAASAFACHPGMPLTFLHAYFGGEDQRRPLTIGLGSMALARTYEVRQRGQSFRP
jgi:hypothetical protein